MKLHHLYAPALTALLSFPLPHAAHAQDLEIIERVYDTTYHLTLMHPDLGEIVAEHVQKIMDNKHATTLGIHDFDHGHLLIPKGEYCAFEGTQKPLSGRPKASWKGLSHYQEWISALQQSELHFMYHTQESIAHPSSLQNPYQGPPRSIIGTLDKNIFPAESDWQVFESHGTVVGHEPFRYNDQEIVGMCDANPPLMSTSNGKMKIVSQFFILPETEGRYTLSDGRRFDVYFEVANPEYINMIHRNKQENIER